MAQPSTTPPASAARIEQLVQAAFRANAAGDNNRAVAIAEQALGERLEHPYLLRISAWRRWSSGNFEEGGALLNRAYVLAPSDPDTIFEIGRLLVFEDRLDEATKAFDDVISVAPAHVSAWYEKASVHHQKHDLSNAEQAFARAHELKPDWPPPLLGLANIAVRLGQLEKAQEFAERVLTLDPLDVDADLILAGVEIEKRQFESARARLEAVLDRPNLTDVQKQPVLSLLGDALDRLDRTSEAFRTYTEMNRIFQTIHTPRFGERGTVENHFAYMERLRTSFLKEDPAIWRTRAHEGRPPDSRGHMFVLSYPRSGNTLVKTILGSVDRTSVVEEMATFQDAEVALLADERMFGALATARPDEISKLREAYWSRAREFVPDLGENALVDMAPLHSIKLPMIYVLFPAAKVVFCRRDPCDVVLSCFTRSFLVNATTFQLSSLESAARHYDAAMSLAELYLERLPLSVQFVRYEDLVTDFDRVTQELARFCGIEWTPEMRRFDVAARRLASKTASATQVRSGLFDGRQKWRRYAEQLEQVLPILEPWRKRYGYA